MAASIAASTVATYFEIFPLDLYFWLLVAMVTMDPSAAPPRAGRAEASVMQERLALDVGGHLDAE